MWNPYSKGLVLSSALALCSCAGLQERITDGDPGPANERATGSAAAADKMAIAPQVQALHAEAVELMRSGHYAKAIAVLKTLTAQVQGLAVPFVNLGIAHLALGEEKPAQEALTRAIEIAPDNAVAYNQLGILHRRAGRFQEARAAYEKALAKHPDYANAHLNLGILCDLYLQNRDCALVHYRRYQALSGGEDKPVSLWLADLSKRGEAKGQ